MSGRLHGRVALVTGAASGIGRAVTHGFVAEGASVVAVDVAKREPEVGSAVLGVRADVTDRPAMEAAVGRALERFGGLDVLCNVAGITGPIVPTGEYSSDSWDEVLAVNLTGAFTTIRAALPALIASGSGSIVNMASAQGLVAVPGMSAYAASKGGLIALTRVIAVEYAPAGVRVNAIAPGIVDTPMTQSFVDVVPPEAIARLNTQIPMGRLGVAADIAGLAVFLASNESAYLTGAVIPVDGGYTAQ
ncbi:SDR family NAD(P)-dependent oxidoreductase [Mycobacterium sp.]|uniref:SDR family NAD(P)-dependent oxidoreductase n=1 Tax=Mycobacterium sp. TaxID=1785 RepID=UPI003BAEE469